VVGRREAAESLLEEMKELARTSYLPPFWFALVYCTLGETDQALGWLERAVEERDPTVSLLKPEPTFHVLRADPRYQALLQRLRLAP